MNKEPIGYTEYYPTVMETLVSRGLLLGTYDADGKPNLMTIGWGMVGSVWSKPLWLVLVRPSRYSHANIELNKTFTLNLPTDDMAEACEICGTRSGRDSNKFSICGLTPQRSSRVEAPLVAESPLTYECRVVHANEVLAPNLSEEIIWGSYRGGNFHRCYWGEILSAQADREALEQMR